MAMSRNEEVLISLGSRCPILSILSLKHRGGDSSGESVFFPRVSNSWQCTLPDGHHLWKVDSHACVSCRGSWSTCFLPFCWALMWQIFWKVLVSVDICFLHILIHTRSTMKEMEAEGHGINLHCGSWLTCWTRISEHTKLHYSVL